MATPPAGDAKNEVPITNLAKIDFPGDQQKGKQLCLSYYTTIIDVV